MAIWRMNVNNSIARGANNRCNVYVCIRQQRCEDALFVCLVDFGENLCVCETRFRGERMGVCYCFCRMQNDHRDEKKILEGREKERKQNNTIHVRALKKGKPQRQSWNKSSRGGTLKHWVSKFDIL